MLTKDIISIVLWIIWLIVTFLNVLGQYYINKEHKKRIEKLEELKELLKISMDDHWFLIKHLLDKEKVKDQGPKIPSSLNLCNEIKRNEKE